MKHLRYLVIGIFLGGAFGAKLGSYVASILDSSVSMQFIEFGFLTGASIGITVSVIIMILKAGVFAHEKSEAATTPVLSYTS